MERSKKVASVIVVGVFILGMALGALLPQLIQNGTSTNSARELYERGPWEFENHGTYEIVKKVIVIDDNASVEFNVDESWEIVEFMFYPLFTNTDWSCNYTLSSASSPVTEGSSGVARDATDHAEGGKVPANRTQNIGKADLGIWTLDYDISGGPVVVEISKVTHWLN